MPEQSSPASLTAALHRLRSHVDRIGTLVAIGSGDGRDMATFATFWPDAHVLLVDMDERFRDDWAELAATMPRLVTEVAALSASDGEIAMRKTDRTGGTVLADGQATRPGDRIVPSYRLDTLIERHALPPPYFLKFDTHGAELPILAGSRATLERTELLMIEAYNFQFDFMTEPNLTFDQLVGHLRADGFRCADLCDPLWRPSDDLLWQLHLFFLRADHPAFASSKFGQAKPSPEAPPAQPTSEPVAAGRSWIDRIRRLIADR